ncbi:MULTISPECIES: RnfH family protein [Vibrio]|uniref:UPF0125 protein F9817_21795 n=2 Tax=Vibrio TaxID=662 RepID=A0A7X4LPQ2_9VIBR|nr:MULTISPECIES: RnfH family protein [Vibrio]MBF9002977.1 RnfH family protein [Vibrio nitrifigilis]MZI95822.1 RnfH family protein [Vibrio eleionomae]
MKVSVVYALPSEQVWLPINVPDDATVLTAIHQSKILEVFPDIDLQAQKVGVFGKVSPLTHELKNGDRVEIYRPLIWQPDDDDDDDDD